MCVYVCFSVTVKLTMVSSFFLVFLLSDRHISALRVVWMRVCVFQLCLLLLWWGNQLEEANNICCCTVDRLIDYNIWPARFLSIGLSVGLTLVSWFVWTVCIAVYFVLSIFTVQLIFCKKIIWFVFVVLFRLLRMYY